VHNCGSLLEAATSIRSGLQREAAQIVVAWMAEQGDVQPGLRNAGQDLRSLVLDLAAWPLRWSKAQLMPLRHAFTRCDI